jgi:hypothetical protein
MAAVEERIVVFGFDERRIKRRVEIGVQSERMWCCKKKSVGCVRSVLRTKAGLLYVWIVDPNICPLWSS